jgi:cell division protein FtsQ
MKKYLSWSNIRLGLMILFLGVLFSFTSHKNEQRKIAKVDTEFQGKEHLFLTQESVNKLLIEKKTDASSIQKLELDLNSLERKLDSHDMIEKSEVFVTIDGMLKSVVRQKMPLARVFSKGHSYYIDNEGDLMPLSDNYTARVPLVIGEIDENDTAKLTDVLRIIHNDEFLQKNIISVEILPNKSLKMKNRNYSYVIEFGRMINVEKKFNNYKAFFQKTGNDSLISKYSSINLKFTQQVVCTK